MSESLIELIFHFVWIMCSILNFQFAVLLNELHGKGVSHLERAWVTPLGSRMSYQDPVAVFYIVQLASY